MSEKRLIVNDDYAWVDTVTDVFIDVEDAFDLVNELHEENEKLKQQRDFYYARLQKIIKIANGDVE